MLLQLKIMQTTWQYQPIGLLFRIFGFSAFHWNSLRIKKIESGKKIWNLNKIRIKFIGNEKGGEHDWKKFLVCIIERKLLAWMRISILFIFSHLFIFIQIHNWICICEMWWQNTRRQEKKSISNFSTHIILCTNQTKKLCRQWQEQERENCHTKSFRPILSLQRKKKNEQEFDDETMGFVTE